MVQTNYIKHKAPNRDIFFASKATNLFALDLRPQTKCNDVSVLLFFYGLGFAKTAKKIGIPINVKGTFVGRHLAVLSGKLIETNKKLLTSALQRYAALLLRLSTKIVETCRAF